MVHWIAQDTALVSRAATAETSDEWQARIIDEIDAMPVDDAEYCPWPKKSDMEHDGSIEADYEWIRGGC